MLGSSSCCPVFAIYFNEGFTKIFRYLINCEFGYKHNHKAATTKLKSFFHFIFEGRTVPSLFLLLEQLTYSWFWNSFFTTSVKKLLILASYVTQCSWKPIGTKLAEIFPCYLLTFEAFVPDIMLPQPTRVLFMWRAFNYALNLLDTQRHGIWIPTG